jgi:signal transduction histidine kinase
MVSELLAARDWVVDATNGAADRAGSATTKGRLLIVDDVAEVADQLTRALAERGYAVAGFTSGSLALAKLRNEEFDVVLADMGLSQMDGVALLRAAFEIDPNVVGIALTEPRDLERTVDAFKAGAFDYVVKPCQIGNLLPVLSHAIEIGSLRRENFQLRESVTLFDLTNALSMTLDRDTILNKIADAVLAQTQANEVSIMLAVESGTALEVAKARGPRSSLILGRRIPIDQGIAGWVARHQEALILNGEVSDVRFSPIHPRPEISASVSLPMLVASSLVGVLNINSTTGRRGFAHGQLKALTVLANVAASAIKASTLYSQQQEELAARRRSEDALRETNLRLAQALATLQQMQHHIVQQERLRALGQMASGIAHDFNNNLATIVGFSDLLLSRPDYYSNAEKAKNFIQMIATAAGDASKVVDRLREFYRHRDETDVLVPVNLNEIAEQAIMLTEPRWKHQSQARGLDIRVETDFALNQPAPGNASELREAITNLILNAVDAMPAGGVLTVRTARQGSAAVLQVADTGTGMTEEVRRRCLEPFFTTKGERGSGLGLSLVYGVVDRHGGSIGIDSAFGHGTTFTISLPLERTETAPSPIGLRSVASIKPQHILVVEDEPSLCKMLVEYLSLDGHTVDIAMNGREGVAKFMEATTRTRPEPAYGLVITDLAMPEMSGAQFARLVKDMSPATPVILLTGFGEMMRSAGEQPPSVDLVVPKPVSLNGLRKAMARALDPESLA